MSSRLTQPEEIELAMREMEMEKSDASTEKQMKDTTLPHPHVDKRWTTGHISAYRAAYIKSHTLDL